MFLYKGENLNMVKLFIIGNGFDLSHGLQTSYEHFRKYLLSNSEIQIDELVVPETTLQADGSETFDRTEVMSLLFYLINEAEDDIEMWKDVETSLGKLDYTAAFYDVPTVFDKDGDENYFKTAYTFEDIAYSLKSAVLRIQDLFKDWIDTINIDNVSPKDSFLQIIGESDLFLTFNYTETLEEIYHIPKSNICYIHGKQNEEIFFGHGEDNETSENFSKYHIGAQDVITELHTELRKKTEQAIELNLSFFAAFKDLDVIEIFSYGFSYSTVDQIYLIKLCDVIDTSKVIWYLNDFDKHSHEQYREKIISAGFKGTFNTFTIN